MVENNKDAWKSDIPIKMNKTVRPPIVHQYSRRKKGKEKKENELVENCNSIGGPQ